MSARQPSLVLVDDNPGFRSAARELFEARGHVVLGEADCAASARAMVALHRPDIAIVDIQLGADCGFDLARALTHSHPSVAVLLVSASRDVADPDRVVATGASGFLPKWELATLDLGEFWRRPRLVRSADRPGLGDGTTDRLTSPY